MLIEQSSTYAYKLKYLDNPTFDKVRGFAKKFIDDLPKELVDELYSQLERGVVQIDSEPQMLVYLYAFGNMHQAKLNKAFENIPELFFEQPDINIIDYGCGQAIGTLCYVDFIRHKGISQKVKRVTLIEPSEICLKRAALHVSKYCPDAEIVTINKEFDELDDEDIVCEEDIPTLHILSNVLDLDFDLDRFAELISEQLKGYNQFVCVGPYFGVSSKDRRMEEFCSRLNGEENYSESFDKFELNGGKAWTAQIRCFSVGELEEKLSTEVTEEDIENGEADVYGVVYSRDGKRLLKGNRELKSYVVKKGTRVICDGAFVRCQSLQQITIPNSVASIGINPFAGCWSLTLESLSFNFIVENGLLIDRKEHRIIAYLGHNEQITIPNSVTSIGDSALGWCKSLQQITIPNSVTSIGNKAFDGCESLQQITIPNSVMCIGDFAFCGCESLQQLNIPNSVTCIGDYAFCGCSSLQQITIPNSVTSIEKSAFGSCKSLQQITIPNSVTSIGDEAFGGCESLQHITIPNSVTSIGYSAFGWCKSLLQIVIPNSVTSIGGEAFHVCESLQQIIIPKSVTSIGDRAFSYCESLQQITIPNSVTSIGDLFFYSCESLQQIIIPNSVTRIGDSAFEYCSSLQQISIPKSVKSIGYEAFNGCKSLKQITLLNSVASIAQNAFEKCESLQQIIIPKGSEEKFSHMFPYFLWDKLYYLQNAIVIEQPQECDDWVF